MKLLAESGNIRRKNVLMGHQIADIVTISHKKCWDPPTVYRRYERYAALAQWLEYSNFIRLM